MHREFLSINRRFCGPPESGNGGYVCGRVASLLDKPAVSVRLRRPPPLDTPLEVRRSVAGIDLFDGDALVAEARAASITVKPPDPPTFAEAESVSRRYRGFRSHWFPCCFVCGPQRDPGDGLRIFPGPVGGTGLVAAPWIPDASLASANGQVAAEFQWAALDCPGAFSFPEPGTGVLLLGELTAQLFGTVCVDEPCVVVAWELSQSGRKHHTATALFGESGDCRGLGLGTWFEVAADTPGLGRSGKV